MGIQAELGGYKTTGASKVRAVVLPHVRPNNVYAGIQFHRKGDMGGGLRRQYDWSLTGREIG